MIDKDLLDILACPETRQDLVQADAGLIEKINGAIKAGQLKTRAGQKISRPIDGGLVQKRDRKYLYPIIDGIPVLLIEEAIPLDGLLSSA